MSNGFQNLCILVSQRKSEETYVTESTAQMFLKDFSYDKLQTDIRDCPRTTSSFWEILLTLRWPLRHMCRGRYFLLLVLEKTDRRQADLVKKYFGLEPKGFVKKLHDVFGGELWMDSTLGYKDHVDVSNFSDEMNLISGGPEDTEV
jgi:hypothetical protein